MPFKPFPPDFYATSRAAIAKLVGDDAFAIIDTADVLRRAGDFEYPFRPDSNFLYLTGVDESEAVLVLAPGHPNPRMREILFLRETNEFMARWAGRRLTQEEAVALSGIKTVMWLDELEDILSRLAADYSSIFLNAQFSPLAGPAGPSERRAQALRSTLPLHTLNSLIPALSSERTVKRAPELAAIRSAIELTAAGLRAAWLAEPMPGRPEYALAAEFTGRCLVDGASGMAFSPIVAGGINATVIHHSAGSRTVSQNDLVLFDVGAEAHYYAADISRTVPASGKFSARGRQIYEVVLRAQKAGIELHKPGTTILEIDKAMRKVLLEGLVELGVLTSKQATGPQAEEHLRGYYGHISHHLGLDVHDTGRFDQPLRAGSVVTCEPGLYLPKDNIGVRLEDVVLITETGHELLSAAIPSHPDDIESTLARRSKASS